MKLKAFSTWLTLATLAIAITTGCDRLKTADTRNDAEIAAEVQNKINANPNLPNKQITVNSNNGTVTLSGTVGNETERMTAANDAATVNGVKTVVNNLQLAGTAAEAAPIEPIPSPTAPSRNTGQRATITKGTRPSGSTQASGDIPSPTAPVGNRATSTPGAAAVAQVTVPEGTQFIIRINDTISSETAQIGDTFTGVLDDPIYVENEVAIPRNADVTGRIVDVKSAGKFKGRSELVLALTSVAYNGRSYQINTGNWSRQGGSRGKNTAAKVGGGAALGAIIGGIAGGGKGAAIGAGVGAGVGTGAQAVTKGEQINLKPETALTFTLEAPVKVAPSATTRSNRPAPGDSE
jgi:hypothetical protein